MVRMKNLFIDSIHFLLRTIYRIVRGKNYRKYQKLRKYVPVSSNEYSLEGFDRLKCIYVHIPKCAGVSLTKAIYGNLAFGHVTVKKYMTIFSVNDMKNMFLFSIVRNPWDRLVSAYFFLKKGGFNDVDRLWFENNLSRYESFDEFVNKWVNSTNIWTFEHFKPQYYYVYLGGQLVVNRVYRFEELELAIKDLEVRLKRKIFLKHKNKNEFRDSDYKSYYNDTTREIVAKVYSKDIRYFNYEF